MKVIDCFPIFNELQLAKFRINYLRNMVDKTIIAESDLTHSGKSKELRFREYIREHAIPNVEVVVINLSKYSTAWEREIATREKLVDYAIRRYPKSLFIISDLDEIPCREQVSLFLETPTNYHFCTPTSFRFANWQLRDDGHKKWQKGVFADQSIGNYPNGGRFESFPELESTKKGIHFSYARYHEGSIQEKLGAFAHTEFNFKESMAIQTTDFANEYAIDHLGRFESQGRGLLDINSRESLSDIQQELYLFEPNWFNFNSIKKSHFDRLHASFILSMMIQEKNATAREKIFRNSIVKLRNPRLIFLLRLKMRYLANIQIKNVLKFFVNLRRKTIQIVQKYLK